MWAPWRLSYVQKGNKKRKNACMFCSKCRSKHDRKNYVIKRTKHSFALLNIFPYNNGHVMIVPKRHVADIDDLGKHELLDMMNLLLDLKSRLKKKVKPHGFNIGINCGPVAGAGIADHVHMHVVPRWNGDTNFMPVFADVRVIPQSLDALYKLLKS